MAYLPVVHFVKWIALLFLIYHQYYFPKFGWHVLAESNSWTKSQGLHSYLTYSITVFVSHSVVIKVIVLLIWQLFKTRFWIWTDFVSYKPTYILYILVEIYIMIGNVIANELRKKIWCKIFIFLFILTMHFLSWLCLCLAFPFALVMPLPSFPMPVHCIAYAYKGLMSSCLPCLWVSCPSACGPVPPLDLIPLPPLPVVLLPPLSDVLKIFACEHSGS